MLDKSPACGGGTRSDGGGPVSAGGGGPAGTDDRGADPVVGDGGFLPGGDGCGLSVAGLAVASTEAALPRTIATETRWARCSVSRLSPLLAVSRRPSSLISPAAAGPSTPVVSTANGTKNGQSPF